MTLSRSIIYHRFLLNLYDLLLPSESRLTSIRTVDFFFEIAKKTPSIKSTEITTKVPKLILSVILALHACRKLPPSPAAGRQAGPAGQVGQYSVLLLLDGGGAWRPRRRARARTWTTYPRRPATVAGRPPGRQPTTAGR